MSNLAVLITCHNRKNKTIKCLRNLFKQKNFLDFKVEIFLVDDNSTDGTADTIKKNFTNINLIKVIQKQFKDKKIILFLVYDLLSIF